MKLLYSNMTKEEGIIVDGNTLLFKCTHPIIIQPSEVVKVSVGVEIEIDKGFVMNVSTHPDLSTKLGEIFPATIVIQDKEQIIFIPVRNVGRNPIHVMLGDIVAYAYFSKQVTVMPKQLEFKAIIQEIPGSRPQRKNPDFKFEIKN